MLTMSERNSSNELAEPALRVCLASDYAYGEQLYNGLVYEACMAIAEMSGGCILAPKRNRSGRGWELASLVRKRLTGFPLLPSPVTSLDENCDLFFYVCMRPDNLLALRGIRHWRNRSGKAAAFLFETWSSQASRYRHYLRLLDDFDHVYLFNPNSVCEIQRYTNAPCTYLAAGVDCLAATPYPDPGPRPIDFYGMGRTDEAVHAQLVELTRKGLLFYLWDRGPGLASNGFAQARFRTYHLIRHSRFFTSFNFRSGSKLGESGGEEAIPARVFEGAAAGAVIVGSRPALEEFELLFDWPDSLIEIPMESLDMKDFYESLGSRPERLRRASITNAAQSLRRHDWVYRWEEILQRLNLPLPSQSVERKRRLQHLAEIAEASLDAGARRNG